jgi:nitrate reductase gamma subunit
MWSPPDSWDRLLFAVLPYAAAAAFFVLVTARRFRVPPFGPPPPPAARAYGERFLLGYGVLAIVGGHVLAFLIPEQVLHWNTEPTRHQVLEIGALVVSLMTLVGLLLTVARCLLSAEARRGVGFFDWVLYLLLLVQLVGGVVVSLRYSGGSSWFSIAVVPYLRSLFRLDPDLGTVSGMPHLVKLHVAAAWVLVVVLPLTRVVRPLIVRGSEEGPVRVRGRVMTAMLLAALVISLAPLLPRLWATPLPGNNQGYEPVQPIAFSHRLHAGNLQMSCLSCHAEAEKGRHAGIPSANDCMSCHRLVTAPWRDIQAEARLAWEEQRRPRTLVSPELARLYGALALDEKMQPDPSRTATPLRWVKVHNLPAFTRFDHGAHVNVGVACQHCHGPVERMERVRQVEDLSMGWCVQCHRDTLEHGVAGRRVRPSNDCTTCHH